MIYKILKSMFVKLHSINLYLATHHKFYKFLIQTNQCVCIDFQWPCLFSTQRYKIYANESIHTHYAPEHARHRQARPPVRPPSSSNMPRACLCARSCVCYAHACIMHALSGLYGWDNSTPAARYECFWWKKNSEKFGEAFIQRTLMYVFR